MKTKELLWLHRYEEAISACRERLSQNPDDFGAVELLMKAFRAKGHFAEALSWLERLEAHHREDKIAKIMTPGSAAWQIDIACLIWLLGDRPKATALMHALAAGILDGSIRYGDVAGGMEQGLLLYYMGVTSRLRDETSFALTYLSGRVERLRKLVTLPWPCPIAQFLLGEISIDRVLEEVNRQPRLAKVDAETLELGRRKRLVLALFYDGIKSRAEGKEACCLNRMRECQEMEDPFLVQEWYLARGEIQRFAGDF